MKRIIIIGGGITGLAAAHRLLERSSELNRPIEILLLEASSQLGGVIRTESREGFLLECGPDSFISEKPETLNLAKRLGITSHVIETNESHRRTFVVRKGRLRPVPEGFHLLAPARVWPFLTSDIFSFAGKARMAADLFLPRREVNGNDDESLADFVRRRFGTEALARMAQPMVGGIYTADPERLSLRATLPRFLDMEQAHRSIILALLKASRRPIVSEGSAIPSRSPTVRESSGTRGAHYSLFLSFDQGMQRLVGALEKRIANYQFPIANSNPRSEIRLNTAVESITAESRGNTLAWKIKTSSNETFLADALCLALPAPAAAKLLTDVAPALGKLLSAVSYASTATINLAYRRPDISHALDGFGFVVPFIENRSLLACTFSSVKFSERAPEGFVLLRAFVGGALQPQMLDLKPAEMIEQVQHDLRDLIGVTKPPLFATVTKWLRSMPQYEVGHLRRVERIKSELNKLPLLELAGNSYGGVGISDCIRSGETAADELLRTLEQSKKTLSH